MMYGAKLIGHSVSRCVNDVLIGRVNDANVKLIIGATRFPMDAKGVDLIINGYVAEGVWAKEDRGKITEILMNWIETGRLHQPRNFGGFAQRSPHTWSYSLPEPSNMTPAAQEAWENFLTIDALGREKTRKQEIEEGLDMLLNSI